MGALLKAALFRSSPASARFGTIPTQQFPGSTFPYFVLLQVDFVVEPDHAAGVFGFSHLEPSFSSVYFAQHVQKNCVTYPLKIRPPISAVICDNAANCDIKGA
jgi:hypothetical protein